MEKTDLGLIIAIVGSAVGIIAVTIALFLWNRSEANSDRRDIANLILDLHKDIQQEIKAINIEMKDFHGRLCNIEERKKQNL